MSMGINTTCLSLSLRLNKSRTIFEFLSLFLRHAQQRYDSNNSCWIHIAEFFFSLHHSFVPLISVLMSALKIIPFGIGAFKAEGNEPNSIANLHNVPSHFVGKPYVCDQSRVFIAVYLRVHKIHSYIYPAFLRLWRKAHLRPLHPPILFLSPFYICIRSRDNFAIRCCCGPQSGHFTSLFQWRRVDLCVFQSQHPYERRQSVCRPVLSLAATNWRDQNEPYRSCKYKAIEMSEFVWISDRFDSFTRNAHENREVEKCRRSDEFF